MVRRELSLGYVEFLREPGFNTVSAGFQIGPNFCRPHPAETITKTTTKQTTESADPDALAVFVLL